MTSEPIVAVIAAFASTFVFAVCLSVVLIIKEKILGWYHEREWKREEDMRLRVGFKHE